MTEKAGEPEDNHVLLRGRVTKVPADRKLPSGTTITTFRVSVPRARTVMTAGSRQAADWVDCTAWTAVLRRRVAGWQVGDPVEVTGSLRRRFYPAGTAAGTRLEVEVLAARRTPVTRGSAS